MVWSSLVRSTALVAVLTTLAACDSAEERAAKHYESGLALLEEGDVQRALVEFRNVVALDANNTDGRLAYARASRSIGNLPESYASYLRIVEQNPENNEARLALTQMAIETQNWQEAERHGVPLIEANADIDGVSTARLALDFRQAALDENAPRLRELTREAEELFQSRPDDKILQRILLEGYSRQGEHARALEIADTAIEQSPDNRQLHMAKAQILNSMGDQDALETHLRLVVERFPDDEQTKAIYVQHLASRGRLEEAEEFMRAELAAAEEKEPMHVALITFLRSSRGNEAASEELDIAINAYEDNDLFRALKASILFDTGAPEEAIALMESVVEAEPTEETDRYKVTLAKMLASTGNEVGARQLVEEVLTNDPGQVPALKMNARWQIDADQPEEALRSLRQALDREPDDAEAMTLMAEAHLRNGNSELSQDLLALAADASGSAPRESMRFARVLLEEGRFRPAEDVLIRALRRTPGNLEMLAMLGRVYIADEDWSRAAQVEDTLRRQGSEAAIRIANDIQLQIFGRREGRDRAVAYLEELAKNDSDSSAATIALIRARLADGESQQALALAEQLVEDYPNSLGAKLVLANAYSALEQFSEAETVLREILSEENDARAALQLVRVLGAQSRADEAKATLDESLEISPENPNLLWAKATLLERSNDIEGAIAIYETLYGNDSGSLVIANNLASLLATYRDDSESLQRARTVARRLRGTEIPPFQDTYGWIQYRIGNFDDALDYLEPAAEALANDPIVQFHLAKTYDALGRTDEATEAFERVLEIAAQNDPRAQIAEARAYLEGDTTDSSDN